MSVMVLREQGEIDRALQRLRSNGLAPTRSGGDLGYALRHILTTGHRPVRPDFIKAWDIELTLNVLLRTLDRGDLIVDLGAYNSAILPALARRGFANLVGVDLNQDIRSGPWSDRIRYVVGDFFELPVAERSVAAVTAISTIEHGWDPGRFFPEIARVLRPGGVLLASTDYWPDKIDTSGVRAFGMSWTVFSESEIRELIDTARSFGLVPVGPIDLTAGQRVIRWSGRAYTFVHIALQRQP